MALVPAADGKSMAAAEQQPTLLRVVGSTLMIDERSVQFPTLYAAGAQEPWRQEIDEHVAAKRIQRIDCQYDTQVNETLTCESFIIDKNVTKEMMLPHTHHGVVAYALAAFLPEFTRVETLRVYTCAHEKLRETILTSAHVRCTIIRNDCLNGYWNTASLALFAKLRSGQLVERLHWNACVIAHTNSKDHFSAPEWALATMQFLNSNDDNDEDDEGDTRYHVTPPRVNANYVMHDFADVWSRTYFDCAYHVALAEYLDLHPVMLHDDGDQASHARVMHEYGLPDESKFICATLAEDRWNIPRFGADAFTPYLANIHTSLARTRILLGGERYAMAQLDNDVDFGFDDLHLREHYSVLLELRRLRFHATLTGQRPVNFSESNFETLFRAPQMPEDENQPPPPPVARGDNDNADDEMAVVPAADRDEVPIAPGDEDVDIDDDAGHLARPRAAEEQKLTPYERQMRLHHSTVPGRLRLAMSNSNRMVDALARYQYRVNQAVIADVSGDIPNIRRMMRESIRCNSLHIHVGYLNLDGYDTDGALLEILKNQSQLQCLKLQMHNNPFPAACRAAENALQRIFEILPDCLDLTSLSLINFPDSIVRKCLTQLLLPVEGRVLLPNLRSLFVSVVGEEGGPVAGTDELTRMNLSLALSNILASQVPIPLSTLSYTFLNSNANLISYLPHPQVAGDVDFLPQLLSACSQLRHLHIDIEHQPHSDCNELYAQVCRMANSLESLSFTGTMDEWHGGGQDVIANSFAATFLNSAQNLRSIAICFRRETSIDEVARAFIRRLQSNTNFDTLSFASKLNHQHLSDDVFEQLANELRGEWRNTRHHINFFTFMTYDNELTLREEERYDWLNHGMQPMRAGAGAASVWHESTSRVLMDMTLRNAPIRPTAMDEASDADWDTEPHAPGLMQHADRFEGRISRDALDECDKSRRRKRADGALIVDSVPLNVSWAPLHQSVGFQPPAAAAAAAAAVDDLHCVFDRRGVVCHMLADDYDAAMSTFILDQLQRLEWMQQVALGMRDVGEDVVVPASPEVQLAATRVNWQGAYQVQAAHIIAEQLGAVPTAYRHGDRDAAIVPLWRPTLGCPSFGQFVDFVQDSEVRGFPFPTAQTIEQRDTSRFQMLLITGVWGPVTSVLARGRPVHYMNGTVDLMGTPIINEARPDEQHVRVYASSNQAPIRIHLPERISSEVRGFYAFDANADDMALLPFSAGLRCSPVCNIPCSQATTLVPNVVDPSESELVFGSSSPVRSGLI